MSNNSDVVGCLGQVRYDITKGDDLVFVNSSMYFSTTISNRYDVGGLALARASRVAEGEQKPTDLVQMSPITTYIV